MNENLKAYEEEVASTAENIVFNLDVDAENLDEQLEADLHDLANTHEWVLSEEKAVQVLIHSDYPTAEFFHHGLPLKTYQLHNGKAPFPFRVCAASALIEDVKEVLRKKYGLNGPLTKKMVKDAQKKTV